MPEKLYPYKPGKAKCDRIANETKNQIRLNFYMKIVDERHMRTVVGK